MAKERISSNVSSELATQIKGTAKKAGLSVSAFIEKAVEGLLGRSCLLVENSRLSTESCQKDDSINELNLKHQKLKETLRIAQQKATQDATEFKAERDRLSRQITSIKSECDVIKAQRQSELCYLAKALGVEYQIEIKKPLDDEYLAKLCEAIHAKIEVLTESHDIFKAASEEKTAQLEASEAQVKALLDRGWWARLWNRVPWASSNKPPSNSNPAFTSTHIESRIRK